MSIADAVLAYIASRPRCETAAEIARAVHAPVPAVSSTLARLAKRGRVKRFRRKKIYPERIGKDAWVY